MQGHLVVLTITLSLGGSATFCRGGGKCAVLFCHARGPPRAYGSTLPEEEGDFGLRLAWELRSVPCPAYAILIFVGWLTHESISK